MRLHEYASLCIAMQMPPIDPSAPVSAPAPARAAGRAVATGIVGITGYTGLELTRLVLAHPLLELVYGAAGATAGQPLTATWPALTGLLDLAVEAVDVEVIASRCEVVFLALPHGASAALAPALVEAGVRVVDLGADFRLRDAASYPAWYGFEHPHAAWLEQAVYGLPELDRSRLPGARLIANPGCYPTAVTLASLPLVGLASGPLIASCLSGVSGAGRNAVTRIRYCETADSAAPYAIGGTHRHTPEMEQNLGAPVVFTPHLVPMNRGIVAAVHAVIGADVEVDATSLRERYVERFSEEPMIVLRDDPPATADVRGSNRVHVHVAWDARRRVATAVAVLDNLVKGAAGQAVQALNAALGLPETTGLPLHPVLP